MKLALNILGGLLVLTGAVWFLQGINVLLGSPMSGTSTWTINGLVVVVVGIGLLVFNNRRKRSK
jgi:hypothetical protein